MTEVIAADKRIQKTQSALRDAFFELVLTYSYDEIKVSDIIEKANVGRSTFYQHYKSKDDMLASSMHVLLTTLADSVKPESSQDDVLALLQHFWENRKFAPRIFGSTARRVIISALADKIESVVKIENKKRKVIPDIPSNLIAHQIAESQMIIIIDWLLGRGSCTDIVLARHINNCSQSIFSSQLNFPKL